MRQHHEQIWPSNVTLFNTQKKFHFNKSQTYVVKIYMDLKLKILNIWVKITKKTFIEYSKSYMMAYLFSPLYCFYALI